MIVANDATVKGGTYYPLTVKKHLRAQEIAQREPPALHLSGRLAAARTCRTRPRSSPTATISAASSSTRRRCRREGIPQIACVMGSCTAGGAYVPAMCDETVIVRDQGTIFLAGPPLVKAATGEVISAEELGGADTAWRASPAWSTMSPRMTSMRWRSCATSSRTLNRRTHARHRRCATPRPPKLRSAEELYGIVPADVRAPYDVHEVIARHRRRLASSTSSRRSTARRWSAASRTSGACRSRSSPTTACCSRESALKGAHFIELACQRRIPLLFLQNISGFMVGGKYEAGGHRQGWRQAGDRGRHRDRAQDHRADRRQLRRRQLRHVRPRLFAALPVHLAQQPHQRDGRRAGGLACSPPSTATPTSGRPSEAEAFKAPDPPEVRGRGQPLLRHRAAVGRRHHRSRRRPATCWAWPSPPR